MPLPTLNSFSPPAPPSNTKPFVPTAAQAAGSLFVQAIGAGGGGTGALTACCNVYAKYIAYINSNAQGLTIQQALTAIHTDALARGSSCQKLSGVLAAFQALMAAAIGTVLSLPIGVTVPTMLPAGSTLTFDSDGAPTYTAAN